MYSFPHIPDAEKECLWFCLLEPLVQARQKRDNPEESRLIQTLNMTQGSHTWETLKNSIETTLSDVKNSERIFSRVKEVEAAENPDNPIEEMFAEYRAIGYLRQKGFTNLKYFRQKGSDFQATFRDEIYHIEVTYIHGPNLKTFHHNPDLIDTILSKTDPNYLQKKEELLKKWEYSKKLTNLLQSRYQKKESQLQKRKVPNKNSIILIITDLMETHEPWFNHEKINSDHPILHFVKTRDIATIVHGSGSVYEPEPTALEGVFGELRPFAWENYSN